MENKNRKPAALRCTAAVFAVLMCASSLSGCLYMTGEKDDGPVVFPHQPIDTSAYTYSEPEDNPASNLWQSLMDTPTSSDGIDYTDEYYDNRVQDGFVFRALFGEENRDKAFIFGYHGTEEEITLPNTLGGLTVTGVGISAFEGCSALRSVTIPEGYTEIGSTAFKNCTALEEINIPQSVALIGQSAFWGCSSLKSIVLPEKITAVDGWIFCGCTSLEEVVLPDTISTIGHEAFRDCTSLKKITIPDSVTAIESLAFTGCTSLESVVMGKGVTELKNSLFSGCSSLFDVTFNGDVTIIGQGTFKNCGFTEFVIPDGVEKVDYNTFNGCEKLERLYIPASVCEFYSSALQNTPALKSVEVDADNAALYSDDGVLYSRDGSLLKYPTSRSGGYVIPDGINSISGYSFAQCKALSSIEIPDSVTSIAKSAFEGTSITSVSIPESVSTIGQGAFTDCPELKSVTIGNGSVEIYDSAFANCPALESIDIAESARYTVSDSMLIDAEQKALVAVFGSSGTLTVPEGIVTLMRSCASGSSITELVLPSTVETIGHSAFAQCESLSKISFGGSEQIIDTSAFKGCTSLKNVELPDSVTTLGQMAFADCSALENIRLSEGLTLLDFNVFQNCTALKELIVPNSIVKINRPCDGCTALSRLILSDNLEEIASDAFRQCAALRELYFPAGVDFTTSSFDYSAIEQIYYGGSKRDWQLGFRVTSGYDYSLDDVEFIYDAQRPTE